MRIFIPTRGRFHQQTTRRFMFLDEVNRIGELPSGDFVSVTYVVPQMDAHLWAEGDRQFIVVSNNITFSDIRDLIMHAHRKVDAEHVVIDDDLYLFERVGDSTKLKKTTGVDQTLAMLQWIQNKFDEGYVHGGISAREGNNNLKIARPDNLECDNTRVTRFHFYRADILHEAGLEYSEVAIRQDFHQTLFLLTRGYPNVISARWAHNQGGSNSQGGCSWYRTPEMMRQNAFQLEGLYPRYVTAVVKDTSVAWGGGERWDVRIQWKKAYKERINAPRSR